MQGSRALLVVLALAVSTWEAGAARQQRQQANPLSKVIELLDTLSAKITKEGEAEAKAYKEFFEWCDDASANKQNEIKTASSKKAKLEAAISKATSDVGASTDKIEELASSLATAAADQKNATSIRAKEAEDFAANEAELEATISTLTRALSVIQKEMAKNPAAFNQEGSSTMKSIAGVLGTVVDAASFSSADKQRLLSLVQSQQGSEADDQEFGAPAAAVYKSQSGGIVDVLEDLKEKAEMQLSDLRKAEVNSKHNFAMLKQSLEDQQTADNKDLADEKSARASAEEAKAIATGDLDATVKDLADAKAALQMANDNCMQTAADHETTVKDRDEELKVIAEAKKILADSTGGAESQAYSMLQTGSASGLRTKADLANAEVLNAVKRLAKEYHSSALAQLASRVSAVLKLGSMAGADPFVKVKELINGLISKLQSEADSEATEKAYCDEQLAKTEEKKSDLEGDIAKLTAKIDQAAARSASLKASVKETQDDLAALAKQQAEMDTIRQESHAAYVQAKADLEAGLAGVRKALGVLTDYYGSGSAASFVQDGAQQESQQPAMPEMHSKASGAGSSIIGILQVVESDFAKSLTQEEVSEDSAQAEYEKMTQENKVSKTLKEKDVEYQTKEFNGLDKQIADLTGDKETADTELSAVLEYYAKVKERCIAKPETYEARKARRDAEIKGLKEALTVLESETAFVQRRKRGISGAGFLGL